MIILKNIDKNLEHYFYYLNLKIDKIKLSDIILVQMKRSEILI